MSEEGPSAATQPADGPSERVIDGAWLREPGTQAVMNAFAAAGVPARFVGGCVRNALLGEAVSDIDIATPARPETVIEIMSTAGLKTVPTGIAHGTVTVVAHGNGYEVTTLRRDVETDGRHAVIAFTADWSEDARRRDLTMNALYADADGRVFDPLGTGVADALAGCVRFIGDPDARITEDYLRILRFFRFYARYGRGRADAPSLAACERHRDGLRRLSAERIGAETMKLLASADPVAALAAASRAGVLGVLLPVKVLIETPDVAVAAVARCIAVEEALSYHPGPLRRMVLLTLGETRELPARLRMSNNQAVHLAGVTALYGLITAAMSDAEARALIYKNGRAVWRDGVVAAWAHQSASEDDPQWRRLAALSSWDPPTFPLAGRDLIEQGYAPGRDLGDRLKDLERAWIASDFTLTREDLLARA